MLNVNPKQLGPTGLPRADDSRKLNQDPNEQNQAGSGSYHSTELDDSHA